jgi:hypothetical protein
MPLMPAIPFPSRMEPKYILMSIKLDRNGNIELVAQVSQLNPHSPWQTPASCPVSQGGVKYDKTSAAKASS